MIDSPAIQAKDYGSLTRVSAHSRRFPPSHFTVSQLSRKKYRECTCLNYTLLTFFYPFMTQFEAHLNEHLQNIDSPLYGTNITNESLVKYLKRSALTGLARYVDSTSRIFLQTLMAAYFIRVRPTSEWGQGAVYLWDMYPRLHEKYFGDLLQMIYLPRFPARLLGPVTPAEDVRIWDVRMTLGSALADTQKRLFFTIAADTIINSIKAIYMTSQRSDLTPSQQRRQTGAQLLGTFFSQGTLLLWRSLFAAVGNMGWGGTGEYWLDCLGVLVGTVAAARTRLAILTFAHGEAPAERTTTTNAQ